MVSDVARDRTGTARAVVRSIHLTYRTCGAASLATRTGGIDNEWSGGLKPTCLPEIIGGQLLEVNSESQ